MLASHGFRNLVGVCKFDKMYKANLAGSDLAIVTENLIGVIDRSIRGA